MTKRSYADVIIIGNKLVHDNRQKKNEVSKEEKKDGHLEKIDLQKICSQLSEEEQSKSSECNIHLP